MAQRRTTAKPRTRRARDVQLTPVKSFGRFRALAPGSITPIGWLRDWARVNADGWLLHYAENRVREVYSTQWQRYDTVRHGGDVEHTSDYSAYFADGLVRYAHLVPESKLARQLTPWLRQVLASQGDDGYIGAFTPEARHRLHLEVFSIVLILEALLYHYEITGGPDALQACERAARHQIRYWRRMGDRLEPELYRGLPYTGHHNHGTCATRLGCRLFALTGKHEYLTYAREVLSRFGRVAEYLEHYAVQRRLAASMMEAAPKSRTGVVKAYNTATNQHSVVEGEQVGLPALVYEYTGERDMLRASEAAWEMMHAYISPDGTPHSNEEMRLRGPRANGEHCGAVEWIATSQIMTRVAGAVRYADAAEHAMYNGYPGAKSADGMLVAYMHAPNQLVASQWSGPTWDDQDAGLTRQHYSTAAGPLCCNVNGPRAIPHFVQGMALADEHGPVVVHYGPNSATVSTEAAGNVTLRQETTYPFSDAVKIVVEPERTATFTVALRIPEWCSSASLEINRARWRGAVRPGRFARVRRKWSAGDEIGLKFAVPLELIHHPDTPLRVGALAVRRGPLTFALPVAEDWQPFQAAAHGPGKRLRSYQILPRRGARWNLALELDPDHPEASLELVRLRGLSDANPWAQPPVGLKVKARRVLNWRLEGERDHPVTPGLPYKPMRLSSRSVTATLVPFGCTHLRMTYLPLVPR